MDKKEVIDMREKEVKNVKYVINEIKEAIIQRDIEKFEQHVDLHLFAESIVEGGIEFFKDRYNLFDIILKQKGTWADDIKSRLKKSIEYNMLNPILANFLDECSIKLSTKEGEITCRIRKQKEHIEIVGKNAREAKYVVTGEYTYEDEKVYIKEKITQNFILLKIDGSWKLAGIDYYSNKKQIEEFKKKLERYFSRDACIIDIIEDDIINMEY